MTTSKSTKFSLLFREALTAIPVGVGFTSQNFMHLTVLTGATSANIVSSLNYQRKAGLIERIGSQIHYEPSRRSYAVYVKTESGVVRQEEAEPFQAFKLSGVFADLTLTPQSSRVRGKIHSKEK